MGDWFLERSKAKLAIAQLAGFLDRWIRRRLREASDGELWVVNRSLWKRCRELATLDSPCKTPSMGALFRSWQSHPLRKYIDEEEMWRYDQRVKADPKFFWVPTDDLTNEELDGYIRWKRDLPPDALKGMSLEDQMAAWRREGRRVLPILPRPGSLPSNANVRRPPNHRERGERPGDPPKADEAKEKASSVGEGQGQVPFSVEDQEVH